EDHYSIRFFFFFFSSRRRHTRFSRDWSSDVCSSDLVKGYMNHERATLENITNARSKAVSAQSVTEKAEAETQLTEALGRFNLVVENYPDLKANQNFLALQEELTSTENKISFARQNYNDQVLS